MSDAYEKKLRRLAFQAARDIQLPAEHIQEGASTFCILNAARLPYTDDCI